ncbi:MAG: hypothetical protein H7210_13755 [Pyrinomonadaceae bacterium]|nr:hypothetical protein [Phycisphaerales bacterium]
MSHDDVVAQYAVGRPACLGHSISVGAAPPLFTYTPGMRTHGHTHQVIVARIPLLLAALSMAGCAGTSLPDRTGPSSSAPPQTPAASSVARPGISDPSLAPVAFMAGSWISEDGGGVTDEHWSAAAGGTMMGTSRTVRGDRTLFYEFLRIESRADGVYYLAAPLGRAPATPFKLTSSSRNAVAFENINHDYPRRISYRLDEAGHLIARIEGIKNGGPASAQWQYTRQP